MLFSSTAIGMKIKTNSNKNLDNNLLVCSDTVNDFDPLVDIEITVTIKEIRALDIIDLTSDPDFYVKVFINDEEFVSPVWHDQKYVSGDGEVWHVTTDVPDDKADVDIKIQLWDKNLGIDKFCDISQNVDQVYSDLYDVDLTYDLKSGHWQGEDYIYPEPIYFDPSGYGRLCGCDDNSIYEDNNDCELWFDITQTDADGDGIPYWIEINDYETDPEFDDTGRDDDEDGIPIEWEWKWGTYADFSWHRNESTYYCFYDPFLWEDHESIDWDEDGLNNYEEYLMSQWNSDPYREDLFIELDQMEGTEEIPDCLLPEGSKELLIEAHNRQNVVYHLDDGCMGGGEMIPFDEFTPQNKLRDIYREYFLHGDNHSWRRGVFHYGLVVYDANFSGYVFSSGDPGYNGAFQISSKWVEDHPLQKVVKGRDTVFASVFMHETGHTLGLNWYLIGGHDTDSYYMWQIKWWLWRSYKSCMNYGYTYFLVDYSDGSRGLNDFDDWENIEYSLFQKYVK